MAQLDFGEHAARAAKWIDARNTDLGLRAGSSTYQLARRLRAGQTTVQASRIRDYETLLRWQPGSIQALADGGQPTELPDEDLHTVMLDGRWETIVVPAYLAAEIRAHLSERLVSPRDTSTAPNPR